LEVVFFGFRSRWAKVPVTSFCGEGRRLACLSMRSANPARLLVRRPEAILATSNKARSDQRFSPTPARSD
jgi:hypothetical protein